MPLCSSLSSFDKCIRRIRLSVLNTIKRKYIIMLNFFVGVFFVRNILFFFKLTVSVLSSTFSLLSCYCKWVLSPLAFIWVVHKCNAGVRLEDDLVANDTIILQGDTCCWICQKCKDYEFVFDKHNCKDCGEGYWPYENKTGCSKLPAKVNTFRVNHPLITYLR